MGTPVATFSHLGHYLDFIPAADVAAGDVVIVGPYVGVAERAILTGILGAIALSGIFDILKSGSTGPVFAVGDEVHFDVVNKLAVHPAVGTVPLGVCEVAAATGDTSVRTRLGNIRTPALDGLVREAVDLTGGSKTLDAEDVGKRMVVTGHATNVVTLPSTAAGLRFVIEAAVDGSRIAVSPAAADKIMGADLAGVDNKDRILAAATARKGDFIVLEADGVNGYFVFASRGVWSAEP